MIISLTFRFTGNNIGGWKHLEFENATSAFSRCHQMIILVERWAAAILNRIAHLSKAFPRKPVHKQCKLVSPSAILLRLRPQSLLGMNPPNNVYCWIYRVSMNRFSKGLAKLRICSHTWMWLWNGNLRTLCLENYKSYSLLFTVT